MEYVVLLPSPSMSPQLGCLLTHYPKRAPLLEILRLQSDLDFLSGGRLLDLDLDLVGKEELDTKGNLDLDRWVYLYVQVDGDLL